jgi:ATP/maltotriose-dependent transcriptional regulator MalT
MSIPLVYMTRLFQLVTERKFSEAERILERITAKMKRNGQQEFNRGYMEALGGIILTYRSSGESYEFFNNFNLNDIEALKNYYKDFLENSQSRFHADYDRGYFTALSDYMRVILKMVKGKTEVKLNRDKALLQGVEQNPDEKPRDDVHSNSRFSDN